MRKLAILLALLTPAPILACEICGGMARRVSLAQEFEQAQVVVYGHIANPKLDLQTSKGTTEFHFDKIVKDDPAFPKQKMVVLSRYLPILDPKETPHFAMFYRLPAKTLEPYTGRQLSSPAVLDFVGKLLAERKKDPLDGLMFAAEHLDDADANIAEEAFLAFAQANDKLVVKAAKSLAPAKVRKLLKTPDLEPEKLSMYAYMLGSCGTDEDADYLRLLLKSATPKHYKAYEGILAGYITKKPTEGWAFSQDLLKSDKNSFLLRYAALRTMRFFYNANPEESGAQVMRGLETAIRHTDVADIAIQDLRQWKRWEHTKLIVACYDKSSHKSPIVRSSIVRYALACPMPEARSLVERVRREDPKLVQYLEEELK
ncbi:MAG TPA: hypothetical protein VFE62_12585 [Gemmataceae bacterium]|nr:hypothetical protein [Gemmataceae bacterium]